MSDDVKKHGCNNRKCDPCLVAQDGWFYTYVVDENGVARVSRYPHMVSIPTKWRPGCRQWEEMGAIMKGLMDPAGCEGCKEKPGDVDERYNQIQDQGVDGDRRLPQGRCA